MNLSQIENDFLDALPERFRAPAYGAYTIWKKNTRFSTVQERTKAGYAYMDGIITAFAIAEDPDGDVVKFAAETGIEALEAEDGGHIDVQGRLVSPEGNVLAIPRDPEPVSPELSGGGSVGPLGTV